MKDVETMQRGQTMRYLTPKGKRTRNKFYAVYDTRDDRLGWPLAIKTTGGIQDAKKWARRQAMTNSKSVVLTFNDYTHFAPPKVLAEFDRRGNSIDLPVRGNPYSRRSKYRHKRLKSKSRFARGSFRTIRIGKHGKMLRVGCPNGKWKRGRCRVGMRAQGLLIPKRRR